MTPQLYWISGPWRGRLAIATRPRGGDWLCDEVKGWREAGLEVVVSLLETAEAKQLELENEADAAESNGVSFCSFPIPDRSVPFSREGAEVFLKKVLLELESGRSVAVHCRQGVGRSGMIAAALLLQAGVGVEEAIGKVQISRGVEVPETAEQLEWLRTLSKAQMIAAI